MLGPSLRIKKKMRVPPPPGFETKADVIVTIIAVYYFKTNCKKMSKCPRRGTSLHVGLSNTQIRLCSLIRVFDGHSMGSHELTVSSRGKHRLWSDVADAQTDLNICCMHMPACTSCWILAYFHSCSTAIPT